MIASILLALIYPLALILSVNTRLAEEVVIDNKLKEPVSAITLPLVIISPEVDIFPTKVRPLPPPILILLAIIVPLELISPEAVILPIVFISFEINVPLALILPDAVILPKVPETTKLFI